MSAGMEGPLLSHRQVWDLIPWIVNASAAPADRQRVDEHLRGCADCRDEFAFQSRIHAGMHGDSVPGRDPRPALDRLLARIDEERGYDLDLPADAAVHARQRVDDRRRGRRAPARSGWPRHRLRVLMTAVIAQSVGLALLGALLIGQHRGAGTDARYETLSRASVPAGPATIRFVPAPGLTVGAMQALLAAAKVRIVESNQGSSIYGLAPDPSAEPGGGSAEAAAARSARTSAALARLRGAPGVLLAEPIVPSTTGAR